MEVEDEQTECHFPHHHLCPCHRKVAACLDAIDDCTWCQCSQGSEFNEQETLEHAYDCHQAWEWVENMWLSPTTNKPFAYTYTYTYHPIIVSLHLKVGFGLKRSGWYF